MPVRCLPGSRVCGPDFSDLAVRAREVPGHAIHCDRGSQGTLERFRGEYEAKELLGPPAREASPQRRVSPPSELPQGTELLQAPASTSPMAPPRFPPLRLLKAPAFAQTVVFNIRNAAAEIL